MQVKNLENMFDGAGYYCHQGNGKYLIEPVNDKYILHYKHIFFTHLRFSYFGRRNSGASRFRLYFICG